MTLEHKQYHKGTSSNVTTDEICAVMLGAF